MGPSDPSFFSPDPQVPAHTAERPLAAVAPSPPCPSDARPLKVSAQTRGWCVQDGSHGEGEQSLLLLGEHGAWWRARAPRGRLLQPSQCFPMETGVPEGRRGIIHALFFLRVLTLSSQGFGVLMIGFAKWN